jgi:MOSC domain-containing protein YiiM
VPRMANARVISVSTGLVDDLEIGGRPGRSAIGKLPREAAWLGTLGLAGDEQGDHEHHGGRDQAVYAYAREDLDWWVERLGRELRDGLFGENITTAGLDITGAAIGETWRMGGATVQVTSARIPCVTFRSWMDEPHWVRRFAQAGRPGAYLRVLSEGPVRAGDAIDVLSRPAVQVTVAESMRAFYGDTAIMRRLLEVDGRGSKWDEIGQDVLARAGV